MVKLKAMEKNKEETFEDLSFFEKIMYILEFPFAKLR